MQSDIESLNKSKQHQAELSAELTDTINSTSASIKDAKRARKNAKDAQAREVEVQTHYAERLLEEQAAALRETADTLQGAMEEEERWLMRVEELRQLLLRTENGQLQATRARQRYELLVSAVATQAYEFSSQQQHIELCLDLLADAMDYFSQSEEHSEFNVTAMQTLFCEVLTSLKHATEDAILAEKDFAMQAQTDPRELMPYKRASAHISGTY